MKRSLLIVLFLIPLAIQAQSIVGKWQLMKQSTCVDDDLDDDDEVLRDMKSMSSPTTQVIQFRDNNTAEENTKIINRRKSYNSKGLLYKYTGNALHILDKKSRTIIESFTIEKISSDSLIISNAARSCETKVFMKIK